MYYIYIYIQQVAVLVRTVPVQSQRCNIKSVKIKFMLLTSIGSPCFMTGMTDVWSAGINLQRSSTELIPLY